MVKLENDWDELLQREFEKEYYKKLRHFLTNEYKTKTVYPDMHHIFDALKYTSYADTKVVILGQDPYHGAEQAHGLCFSVSEGTAQPPSLQNIFKEIESDIGTPPPKSGELIPWAKQGVLLLNTVLTVRAGEANSHKNQGWELFTDQIVKGLNEREEGIVFVLWGGNAKTKGRLVTNPTHKILTSVHPSPLSAYNGFFGCKHFSKTNAQLKAWGKEKICW